MGSANAKEIEEDLINKKLPIEVFERIFGYDSAPHLLRQCRRVCSHWNNIIGNQTFWLQRCLDENVLVVNLFCSFLL
jgi:hypothetical protein